MTEGPMRRCGYNTGTFICALPLGHDGPHKAATDLKPPLPLENSTAHPQSLISRYLDEAAGHLKRVLKVEANEALEEWIEANCKDIPHQEVWQLRMLVNAILDSVTEKAYPTSVEGVPPLKVERHREGVRLVMRAGQPHGIRDDNGYLLFFPEVQHYTGQDERFARELRQRTSLAQGLRDYLEKRACPNIKFGCLHKDGHTTHSLHDIIRSWLISNGYDGLASEECGCTLDDLMPCDEPHMRDCNAAYRHDCDYEHCEHKCEAGYAASPAPFCMRTTKPHPKEESDG